MKGISFILSGVLFCCFNPAFAQRRSENALLFTVGGQRYLHSNDVVNTNPSTASISAKNTNGYDFTLGYKHTSKYGLVLEAEVLCGSMNYNVGLHYDLAKFDPDAAALKGNTLHSRVSMNNFYCGIRMMTGYHLKLNNKWGTEFRAGIRKRIYLNKFNQDKVGTISYTDNSGNSVSEPLYLTYSEIQNREKITFNKGNFCYDLYLGVDKEINKGYLQKVSLGVELSRFIGSVHTNANFYDVNFYDINSNASSGNTNPNYVAQGAFYDKAFFIGLRLGVSLF